MDRVPPAVDFNFDGHRHCPPSQKSLRQVSTCDKWHKRSLVPHWYGESTVYSGVVAKNLHGSTGVVSGLGPSADMLFRNSKFRGSANEILRMGSLGPGCPVVDSAGVRLRCFRVDYGASGCAVRIGERANRRHGSRFKRGHRRRRGSNGAKRLQRGLRNSDKRRKRLFFVSVFVAGRLSREHREGGLQDDETRQRGGGSGNDCESAAATGRRKRGHQGRGKRRCAASGYDPVVGEFGDWSIID